MKGSLIIRIVGGKERKKEMEKKKSQKKRESLVNSTAHRDYGFFHSQSRKYRRKIYHYSRKAKGIKLFEDRFFRLGKERSNDVRNDRLCTARLGGTSLADLPRKKDIFSRHEMFRRDTESDFY